ncbi:Mlp lipoprotein family protein (plasmid) [Borrelia crocidurae DOU]|uniref:Mlp lipoprotein family protein n=1 Tax=Borrelia crocidurae DOU TaxID=1293575 RepID=W5SLC2_9SPIR|nr:Mlp family lipoprotein [Borrelia crocidurae]AHH07685.1 Mlp lipoprotein family protein [Borrelia crocidurae DOU]
MNKLIILLIIILILSSCKEHSKTPKNTQNFTDNSTTHNEPTKIDDTNIKFNVLHKALQNTIEYLKRTRSNELQNNQENRYNQFFEWILKHPNKQKELANSFTTVYNFLQDKQKKNANNSNLNTYINNALTCQEHNSNPTLNKKLPEKCHKQYNSDSTYNTINFDLIAYFFKNMILVITTEPEINTNINEKIFNSLKAEFINTTITDSHINGLISRWQD